MRSNNSTLKIDEQKAVEQIEGFIKDQVDQHSVKGVMLGLSGGIDSALLATLSTRVLGSELVEAYHLHDRDSERESTRHAQMMADWLGLQLNIVDISPAMEEKHVYKPGVMRYTAFSRLFNRIFGNNLYRFM